MSSSTPLTQPNLRGLSQQVVTVIQPLPAGEEEVVLLKKRRRRRQIKKNKWRRRRKVLQRMERRSKEENLFTNFSHVVLTPDQVNLLNKEANFCPTRESVNKTEVKVSNFRWERSMRWLEFWHGKEGDQVDLFPEL